MVGQGSLALVDPLLLGIELWQWIALLALAVLAWAISWGVVLLLGRYLGPAVRRSPTVFDEVLLAVLVGPFRLGAGVLVFAGAALALGLPPGARQALTGAVEVVGIAAIAWAAVRAVDLLAHLASDRLAARGRYLAIEMVPIGARVTKAIVVIFAGLVILQAAGVDVAGVITGSGQAAAL